MNNREQQVIREKHKCEQKKGGPSEGGPGEGTWQLARPGSQAPPAQAHIPTQDLHM